jgi:cell division protein FtsL
METITTDDKIRLKQMQIQFENEPQHKQELQKQLQKLQLEKEIEGIRKRIEQLG